MSRWSGGDFFAPLSWPAGCEIQEALAGCKDNTGKVLIEGVAGEAVGGMRLTKGTETKDVVFQKEIAPAIEEFTFASYSTDDDFLLDEQGTVLEYDGTAEVVTFPEGQTTIDGFVFGLPGVTDNIKMKIVPEGYTTLGYKCFFGLPNVEVIILPDSLTSLGAPSEISDVNTMGGTMSDCAKLRYVHLPSTLKHLPASTVFRCPLIISINIPTTLESVGNWSINGATFGTLILPNVQYFGTGISSSSKVKNVYVFDPAIVHNSIDGSNGTALPYQILRGNGNLFAPENSTTLTNADFGHAISSSDENYYQAYQNKGTVTTLNNLTLAQTYIFVRKILKETVLSNTTTQATLLDALKAKSLNKNIDITSDAFTLTAATEAAAGTVSGNFVLETDGMAFDLALVGSIAKVTAADPTDPDPTDPADPDPTDPTDSDPPDPKDSSDSDDTDSPKTGDGSTPAVALIVATMSALAFMIFKKIFGFNLSARN